MGSGWWSPTIWYELCSGRLVRIFLLAFCLLAATACDESPPIGPTVPLNEQFTLAPGELAHVQPAATTVQFVGVTGDSRCPANAICIWLGDATVHLRIFGGRAPSDYELHTGDSQRRSVLHRDLRIELIQLQPYPFSSRTIDPSDYRATMLVRR